MNTYESAAGVVGMEDVNPFYVGLSVAAAGSILLLATCGCGGGGAGRKKKKAPSKKKKSKAKSKTGADTGAVAVASNGSAFKNGGSGVKVAAPVANGGASRGLPAKQTNHVGSGRSGSTMHGGVNGASGRSVPALKTSKAVKKPPATKSPQVSEKARGNLARGAPPVITVRCASPLRGLCFKRNKPKSSGGTYKSVLCFVYYNEKLAPPRLYRYMVISGLVRPSFCQIYAAATKKLLDSRS